MIRSRGLATSITCPVCKHANQLDGDWDTTRKRRFIALLAGGGLLVGIVVLTLALVSRGREEIELDQTRVALTGSQIEKSPHKEAKKNTDRQEGQPQRASEEKFPPHVQPPFKEEEKKVSAPTPTPAAPPEEKKPETPPACVKPDPKDQMPDAFGNPINERLGQEKEFTGKRILVWCRCAKFFEGNFSPTANPLWASLRELGFELQFKTGAFDTATLDRAHQLWLISYRGKGNNEKEKDAASWALRQFGEGPKLTEKDWLAIERFLDWGKGVYALADNAPFLDEANAVARRWFGARVRDEYKGMSIAFVRRPGLDDVTIKRFHGAYAVADHPLLTGVNFIYEGATVSHITASPSIESVMPASDGKILVAVSRTPGRRVVFDGGFTRYYVRLIGNSAGSVRFGENVAAYLMGKGTR